MKNILLFIFFFVIFFMNKVKGRIIEIPINYTEFNHPIINLCLGTPKQCLPFKLSLNLDITYVIDYNIFGLGFEKEKSHTLSKIGSNVNFTDRNYNLQGFEVYDILQTEKNFLKKGFFKFYIVNKGFKYTNYCGVVGLKNSSFYSFINFINLYGTGNKNNIIEIKTNNEGNKGSIIFGNNISKDYNKINYVNETNPFEIFLNKVILFNDNYPKFTILNDINESVLLSPEHNKIYCPEKFLNYLMDNLFNKFDKKETKSCLKKEEKGVYKYLLCNSFLLKESIYIYFIFGKWNAKFLLNDLFTQVNDKLLIFNIMNLVDEDKWIFGNYFFKFYDFIYESKTPTLRLKKIKK